MKTKKIATYGLLVALAFILSYVETLVTIPFPPVPGMKLGLANLVVLAALYTMGGKESLVLSVLRIVLVGFTFGHPSTMLFSIAGGLLSWILMLLFMKTKWFSLVGVSIVGGISHNIGQILVAIYIVDNINIAYYLPYLLITGAVTGTLIGILGAMIVKRIKNVQNT
ncbi:MAG: putative rane protein [Herbinix sp.]|jgi:heptaprenyl diphosphate synthase|nr:putative rane protein [Herbinix sp.]